MRARDIGLVCVWEWGTFNKDADSYVHTLAQYHILTARRIVVHVNSLQLKDRVSHIVACWVNAMFITYDFPKLSVTKK